MVFRRPAAEFLFVIGFLAAFLAEAATPLALDAGEATVDAFFLAIFDLAVSVVRDRRPT